MAIKRFFYVTQEELIVYLHNRGVFDQSVRFNSSEEGLRAFSSYLQATSQQATKMLIVVIEEELSADSIPKLGRSDRKSLLERRLLRKFPRTPYRLGHYQAAKQRRKNAHDVMYSAVSNPELLDPWLQIMMVHKTPLSGIQSVPLLADGLLEKLFKARGNALFMTLHQGNMLRQIFVRDGYSKSARLSKSPDVSASAFGDFVFAEVLRSRHYLERNRLLGAIEDIDIYLVTDEKVADQILASDQGAVPAKIHFIDPAKAASLIGLRRVPECDHLEMLYLAILARGKSRSSYALQSESRFFRLRSLRHAIVGVALAASIACGAVAGINLVDGLFLKSASAATDKQIQQISETLQRENESTAPVRANSHEMKLAVDTGDYILRNRLPVSWVMREVASVLGDFPQVQIDTLSWLALPPVDPETVRRRSGDRPLPASIPVLQTVSVELSAQILPFDGDMREAFAMIDRLVTSLRENTAFNEVLATEYPLDASPQSAISGEVVRGGMSRSTQFRLRLNLDTSTGENADEIG